MYIQPNLSFVTKVGMELRKLVVKVNLVEKFFDTQCVKYLNIIHTHTLTHTIHRNRCLNTYIYNCL
jgi:hypothetical protein